MIDGKGRLHAPQVIVHQDPRGEEDLGSLRLLSKGMCYVTQELGKGAYGVVYKGKEKNGVEWRAIKKIAKKNIKQPELLVNEI